MSTFSRKTPIRRVAALAAPLAVAALALTACNPVHVHEIASPTPSGSNLATPYSAAPEGEAHASSAAPSSTHLATDAASFFTAADPTEYSVTSITLGSSTVDPGAFESLSVYGDAASAEGSLLTTIGLCDGAVYTATGKGATVASSAGASWATDKCGDPADEAVAKKVHEILEGKVTASVSGTEVTLKGSKGSIVLSPLA